ncbi:MAG: 6-pyruvoyl-tetrahydropterin synthase-related protein [Lachnospira pectinoschiza]
MRYWAPLTAYYMALCQMIAGGGQLAGYLIFVGSVCFFNSILWLIIGRKMNRPYLGAFVGLIWFFMPNNLLALFVEGNLARSLCMIFLPVFIYAVCEYLSERKRIYIPIIIVTFALMAMCHLGYAGMIALAVLIYCIVYMFSKAIRERYWK